MLKKIKRLVPVPVCTNKQKNVIARMLESLAGCRTMFLLAVSCMIGAQHLLI